jgi:cell division protein ZapA
MEQPESLRVTIFDQVYTLKSEAADRAYLTEVAQYVDQRMHAIAARTQTVDSFRIAVLAALHIADELFRLRKDHQRLQESIESQSSRCVELLEEALAR